MTNKKITQTAALAAAAVVLGYVETIIPVAAPVPGIKIGLSNLAVLFALYKTDIKSAAATAGIKVAVTSLLFSGIGSIIYALFGGFLSLFIMYISKKNFSIRFVSTAGGIAHNIGQLAAAAIVLKSGAVIWYLPYLLIGGAAAGFLIGIVCEILLKKLK